VLIYTRIAVVVMWRPLTLKEVEVAAAEVAVAVEVVAGDAVAAEDVVVEAVVVAIPQVRGVMELTFLT
jgi:hypothetical protein